jgi:uncharacterized membrane protein YdbT with pleckstrin-like domain
MNEIKREEREKEDIEKDEKNEKDEKDEKEENEENEEKEEKEETKDELKEEDSICYSSPEPLHFISKPVEVQFDMPVHAQIFMPQQIADLIIQEPLLDVTRAATGAVIYDGLIHKQQCGCTMS